MPRRRYVKKTRRRRKTYRRRRKRKSRSSVWKTAVRAVKAVTKKQAQPLYVRKTYANYDPQNGQFANLIGVSPGPDNGFLDPTVPLVIIPPSVNSFGLPGTRSDQEITITGISTDYRFILPQNVSMAKVAVYLFMDTQHESRTAAGTPLLPVAFKCPDEFFMLRNELTLRADMKNIRILARRQFTIRSNPNSSGNNQSRTFRDLKIWWKPKKGGLKYKYIGPAAGDLLNRSIGVCVKASFPHNPNADPLQMGGVITTYYRDYK